MANNCTVICRGSQPAETVNEPRERAGLRRARLRPARPKGRKTCPSHLIVRFLWMRFSRITGLCVQAALRLPGIGAKHFIYDEDRTSGRSGASQKTSVKIVGINNRGSEIRTTNLKTEQTDYDIFSLPAMCSCCLFEPWPRNSDAETCGSERHEAGTVNEPPLL